MFKNDRFPYTKYEENGVFTAIVTCVDDLLVARNFLHSIHNVKDCFHEAFTIKDLGPLKYFCDVEVFRKHSGKPLNQRKIYI